MVTLAWRVSMVAFARFDYLGWDDLKVLSPEAKISLMKFPCEMNGSLYFSCLVQLLRWLDLMLVLVLLTLPSSKLKWQWNYFSHRGYILKWLFFDFSCQKMSILNKMNIDKRAYWRSILNRKSWLVSAWKGDGTILPEMIHHIFLFRWAGTPLQHTTIVILIPYKCCRKWQQVQQRTLYSLKRQLTPQVNMKTIGNLGI